MRLNFLSKQEHPNICTEVGGHGFEEGGVVMLCRWCSSVSGYVSPLACILMCHASPFIMMVGNRVLAAGAVQYRLLSGTARRERPYSLPIFVELSQWQTERGATPALHG
ncbi:hypothetical protein ACQJBY_037214 [Aegilops geniculata]